MAEVVLSGVIISDDGARSKVFIEEQLLGEHTADTSRADGLVMPYSTLDKEHSNTPTTQDILRL